MHAVIRNYSGGDAPKLYEHLEAHKADVEKVIRGIDGFVSYLLARTDGGGFSVSVFQDKAGADESVKAARDYISKEPELTNVSVTPNVIEGRVIVKANGSKKVLMQLTTGDYNRWREHFDSNKGMRQDKAGVTSEIVYQNTADPNQVLCLFDVNDVDQAIATATSDEVKSHMAESGVVGPPHIHTLS